MRLLMIMIPMMNAFFSHPATRLARSHWLACLLPPVCLPLCFTLSLSLSATLLGWGTPDSQAKFCWFSRQIWNSFHYSSLPLSPSRVSRRERARTNKVQGPRSTIKIWEMMGRFCWWWWSVCWLECSKCIVCVCHWCHYYWCYFMAYVTRWFPNWGPFHVSCLFVRIIHMFYHIYIYFLSSSNKSQALIFWFVHHIR